MKKTAAFILLVLLGGSYCLFGNLPCTADHCSGASDCPCTGNQTNNCACRKTGSGGGKGGMSGGGGDSGGISDGGIGAFPALPPFNFFLPIVPATGWVSIGSLSVTIHFGSPAGEALDLISQFSVYSRTSSPLVFTPQLLQYRNRLLDRISQTDVAAAWAEQILGANWEELIENGGDGGFGRVRIDNGLGAGITHQVRLFDAERKQLLFQFRSGSAIG